VVDEGAKLPVLSLSSALGSQPVWSRVNPAREVEAPLLRSKPLIWSPVVERRVDGRAMLTAMFVSESKSVFGSGFLHVQLVNAGGMVYAEMKQTVPVLPGRQAVQLSVPIPTEFLSELDRVAADMTPLDSIDNVTVLEMGEEPGRLVDRSASGATVELTVLNPFHWTVADPTVVVSLWTLEGWPLGEWRGTVSGGRIDGFESLRFRAVLPVAEARRVGRVTIRGYARKP
jgi:hypothetical protein